ncbi:MAG: DUF6314 family protein [Rubrimonas sp.]
MGLTTEARFAGVWSVAREIEDFAGGPAGRFRGLARITPDGQGLRYAEQGLLTLGASRLQASRAYLWRPLGPTLVQVCYEDGAPFHRFDWSRIECEDAHLCGEDRYQVRYSFAAESWHAHWRVQGPRKDYASTSRYLRAA